MSTPTATPAARSTPAGPITGGALRRLRPSRFRRLGVIVVALTLLSRLAALAQVGSPANPGAQRGRPLNGTVALSWTALPDSYAAQFDHYAIYRATSSFTNVADLTPIAVLSNYTAAGFMDPAAGNGIPWYYAVTTVNSAGGENQNQPAIGPFTPYDETDLQVMTLSRTPRFPRYAPIYTDYATNEPSGYGPYSFSAATGLGQGQTASTPRWPTNGQPVTYTATVRNRGSNPWLGDLHGVWTWDGAVQASPVVAGPLPPDGVVTFSWTQPWDGQNHAVGFSLADPDARTNNNARVLDTKSVAYLSYVDQTYYEDFRARTPRVANPRTDDLFDWANRNLDRFNEMFAQAGSPKRVHLDVLQMLADDAPDPVVDTINFAIFPFRFHAGEGDFRLGSGYYDAGEDIDYGYLHEMGHQLGLIDLYQMDVPADWNQVSHQGYSVPADLMNGCSHFLSPHSALAMTHWEDQAHGYFGQYLYGLPAQIRLRLLGYDGTPLSGATVKMYQWASRPGVGQGVSAEVKAQGVTDSDGVWTLPNVPIDHSLAPALPTGDALPDNPFGYVAVIGNNGVLHFQVEHQGFTDFAWLDITEPNIAYYQGQTNLATFTRTLALGGPIQTNPPAELTEAYAGPWAAWAEGSSALNTWTTNDTERVLVGANSLKFVTDGGFDTYARYPAQMLADWDLTAWEALALNCFADNPNPGFQNGSPWIRLKDNAGNYFQYQYFQNGDPADLLNNARGQWGSFLIPLDASATENNGWRRTTSGTPNLGHIASLELHADTWGNGFTLWWDGVSFTNPPPLILTEPASGTNVAGDQVVFQVTVAGKPPLAYQWWKDGLPLTNLGGLAASNNLSVTLSNVVPADAGNYWVVVSNAFGSVTSEVARLSVLALQRTPPADMTEASAGAWSAWGDGSAPGNTWAAFNTQRVVAGTNSLLLVTDSGGDTFVSYPADALARWDLTGYNTLVVYVYAENPNGRFEWGSPWIRLRGANGSFFQYQCFQNNNPYDLLNQAIGQWQRYVIPLAARSDEDFGWRRTVAGNPDLAGIEGLEIHADTAGNGFRLWVDGVSFTNLPPELPYHFSVLAGPGGGRGNVDGWGGQARFAEAHSLTADTAGNVFVADTGNAAIRRVTREGEVTTVAGYWGGWQDGVGAYAQFAWVCALAIDPAGNLYTCDADSHVIRLVAPDGTVKTLAGRPNNGGATDGPADVAQFLYPQGLARDAAGNLLVADTGNHTIRRVAPDGTVSTLAGLAGVSGSADGVGSQARFWEPAGLALDANGNLYVADRWNHAIRKVTPAGEVSTYAGRLTWSGAEDGYRTEARFNRPQGLAMDALGALYVVEEWNQTVRRISPHGVVTTIAGTAGWQGSADGWGTAAQFRSPSGITVDAQGNVVVADTYNYALRRINAAGQVSILAGRAPELGSVDGPGREARFSFPASVAADAAGNVFVADSANQVIRKLAPNGTVTTLAGHPGWGGYQDGAGSAAVFSDPRGVAVDAAGNVIVADHWNHVIRRVSPDGVVTTLAGVAGQPGAVDGPAADARFAEPFSVAIDAATNIYVADRGNSIIRKITPEGMVSTLAGMPGQSGLVDGQGSAARFSNAEGIAVDTAGNVYVADTWNAAVRRISPQGAVVTIAGEFGSDGAVDGAANRVRLAFPPTGVATDAAGNVYITGESRTIQRLSPEGQLTTLAGHWYDSATREGTGRSARFMWPRGLAVTAAGDILVADSDANCVWRGRLTTCLDQPHADQPQGPVGERREFSVVNPTGSAWKWTLVRRPAASRAALTGESTATPSFVPDVPDHYVFLMAATNPAGDVAIRELALDTYISGSFRFSLAVTNVPEDAGSVAIDVERTGDTNGAVSVDYVTLDGTAHRVDDFLPAQGTLTFLPGQTNATVVVPVLPDALPAGTKAFVIALSNAPTGWSLQYPRLVQVNLLDRESALPTIAGVSSNQTVVAGQMALLSVAASGPGPLTYQWLKDNVAIAGATDATLRVDALTAGLAGGYRAVVGNSYGARTSGVVALNISQEIPEYTFTILAGNRSGRGFADGPSARARFVQPWGLAVDPAGNVFVADASALRVVSPGGEVKTLAGTDEVGYQNGWGGAVRFQWVVGVAVDPAGGLYTVETDNQIIRRVLPDGRASLFAGQPGQWGQVDGPADTARFAWPSAIARGGDGTLYIADTGSHTIRKIAPDGGVTTLAGSPLVAGAFDAAGTNAQFRNPRGIAVDPAGRVYVADSDNNAIRLITPEGVVTTYAGRLQDAAYRDGPAADARFNQPTGLALDANGNLYVADRWNHVIRRIGTDGMVSTVVGAGGQAGAVDGPSDTARLSEPTGVAVDARGNIFIAEFYVGTIRKATPDGQVTTLAGTLWAQGMQDGEATQARFNSPRGIAVNAWGDVFVADGDNAVVRRISPGGQVTTLAGQAGIGGSQDGPASQATFGWIWGLALDAANNVYVADRGNHTLRKITPEGEVSTLAGAPGQPGSDDGAGGDARFNQPLGVAVDGMGNVFVSDQQNFTIRRVTPQGAVRTLAGQAGVSGARDGVGTNALFGYPEGLAVDAAGNLYVADRWNHAVRKVTPQGVVTTVAGHLGQGGYRLGRAQDSYLDQPCGLAFDAAGNLYITFQEFRNVLRLDPLGGLTEVSGRSGLQIWREGSGADAFLPLPYAIAAGPDGRLYVTDADHRIWQGEPWSSPDWPELDAANAPVGQTRALGIEPQTATQWEWSLLRCPAGSVAAVAGADTTHPTFTPDVPDTWRFRLATTNDWGRISIRTLEFTATNSGGFYWSAPALALAHDAGGFTVAVQRVGDTTLPASVTFTTADGSALSGVDYAPTNGTLVFPAGQGTNFVTVVIADTVRPGQSRSFSLSLGAPSPGWNLLYPEHLVVTVINAALPTNTQPARIASQPRDASVVAGAGASFTATATGAEPLAYRWQFNGVDLADNARAQGAGSPALTLAGVGALDAGSYRLVVTNDYGAETSAAASLTVWFPPQPAFQPSNQIVLRGTTAQFQAPATGTPPLAYQWWFNQTNLLIGATNATLTVTNVGALQAGTYTVTIQNGFGEITNLFADLLVADAPTIVWGGALVSATNPITGSRAATLSARVNPDYLDTAVRFEYGLSTAYGGVSVGALLPAGGTATNVSAVVDALLPGLAYHCRGMASNLLGVAYTPDLAVTIPSMYLPGDLNGDGIVDQTELNAVLANYWPNSPWLWLTNTAGLGSTNVQFALTNTAAWKFSVLVSTNLVDWQYLGPAAPLYQFGDPRAGTGAKRFYRLSWP